MTEDEIKHCAFKNGEEPAFAIEHFKGLTKRELFSILILTKEDLSINEAITAADSFLRKLEEDSIE